MRHHHQMEAGHLGYNSLYRTEVLVSFCVLSLFSFLIKIDRLLHVHNKISLFESSIEIEILGGGGCRSLGDVIQAALGVPGPLGTGDHHQVLGDAAHAHPSLHPHVASLPPHAPGVLDTHGSRATI